MYRRSHVRQRLLSYAGVVLSVVAAVVLGHAMGMLPWFGGPSDPGDDPPALAEPEPFPVPSGDPALSGPDQLAAALEDESTPLVRTDRSDDASWQQVVDQVTRAVDFENPDNPDPGEDGYAPYITVITAPDLEGATGMTLAESARAGGFMNGYVILADARSMSEARSGGEVSVDYVDLSQFALEDAEMFDTFPGNTFRCAVDQIASVEANLSIANVDFSDFADAVDADGVFRG